MSSRPPTGPASRLLENFVTEFCTHTGIPTAPGSQIQQQAHSWRSLRSHSPGDPRPLLQLQVLRPPGNTHTGTEQKTRSNGKQLERGFNKKQGLDCSDVCRAQSDKNTIYQTPSLFTPSGGSSCEVPPPGEPQCSLQLHRKLAHLPLDISEIYPPFTAAICNSLTVSPSFQLAKPQAST